MRIHLHSRRGMYTVDSYDSEYINLYTHRYRLKVPVDDFKAFAGGTENWGVTVEETDKFLSVVQPERYQNIIETEAKLLETIKHLQAVENNKDDELYDEWQDEDDYELEYEEPDYKDYWKKASDEVYTLNRKLQDIAYQVYSQKLDFSKYQNNVGVKFIIQQNRQDENDYRLRFDPYGFVSNGHSAISDIFILDNWSTINGGWLKVINNDVILYAKSGDYGVYDDSIGIQCAKKVFTGRNIISYAGKQWENITELL